jgi:hypothetical protein
MAKSRSTPSAPLFEAAQIGTGAAQRPRFKFLAEVKGISGQTK